MSKIKSLITAPIKKNNSKRISTINDLLFSLSEINDPEDISSRYEKEVELVRNIDRLSGLSRKENSSILQELQDYFIILFHKGRMMIDSAVESDSISLFSDYFLDNKSKVLDVFNKDELQKVILFLVTMNLSIHSVNKASRILEEYYEIFTYVYRARLIVRLMVTSCGYIDRKYVDDLYENVEQAYNGCTTLSSKAEFINNVFQVEKNTGWECGCLDKIIHDLHKKLRRVYYSGFTTLYTTFLQFGCYPELADEWIKSIDKSKIPENQIKAFEVLTELLNRRTEGKRMSETARFKEPANTGSLAYKYDNIFYLLRQRTYSRSRLAADIEEALAHYKDHGNASDDTEARLKCGQMYFALKNLLSPVKFWADFEENYKKVASSAPDIDENVRFFFINEYSLVNGALSFPVIMGARKAGIRTWCITPSVSPEPFSEDDPFNDLEGFFSGDNDIRSVQFNDVDYDAVDIENKSIMVHGMNVYQPIFEFVTRYQFTYDYKYETDAWARSRTHFLMRTYDRLFTYIEKIEKVAAETGTKVYFVSHAPHIHNAAAFRIYCEEKGYRNGLEYICASPGYDNYFANSSDPKAATITTLNLTQNPDSRNAFLGTKEGFEKYYEKNRFRIDEVRRKMEKHLTAQRGRDRQEVLSEEKEKIVARLKKAKEDGKTIIVLNGKVIIDLAVKYTKGCVHSDMSEWITHAVRFAGEHPDEILLLIKPHPHENRADLTLTSEKIDDLRSLIKCELSDNTIYLDNDMFRISELVPYMDLGMVWNGTSSVEFAAQGIKTLIADEWGHLDYPIGFTHPGTIEEYESYMLDPSGMKIPEDLSDRAIVFLEYMGSEDVRIINPYSSTSAMNFHQYDSKINKDAVDDFIENGDPVLERRIKELL